MVPEVTSAALPLCFPGIFENAQIWCQLQPCLSSSQCRTKPGRAGAALSQWGAAPALSQPSCCLAPAQMAVQALNFALSKAITGHVLAAACAWGAGMEFGKILLLLDEQFSISRLLSYPALASFLAAKC